MKPIISSQSYKLATFFIVINVVPQCLIPAKGVSSGYHLGNETDHAAVEKLRYMGMKSTTMEDTQICFYYSDFDTFIAYRLDYLW